MRREWFKKIVLSGILPLFLTNCVAPVARGTTDSPDARPIGAPIKSGEGTYISPIRADGMLAAWVIDGMKNFEQNRESESAKAFRAFTLPYYANLLIDKKAQSDAPNAFGGWERIRSTSDLSFNSVIDFRHYLLSFKGRDVFTTAWAAAASLYPEVGVCGHRPSC